MGEQPAASVWDADGLRHLRGARPGRLERAKATALQLAAEGGYDAVTMHRIAEVAKVSRASLYQHFWSKDHLLAAALSDHAREIVLPPSAAALAESTAAARVLAFFEEQLDAAEANVPLVSAFILAVQRAPNEVIDAMPNLFAEHLETAIGDALPAKRRSEVARALEYMYSTMTLAVVGRGADRNWVRDELRMCVRLLLGRR